MDKPLYALSIKQPWAWLICKGCKDIENRDWKLPQKMIEERIYVHASKTKTGQQASDAVDFIAEKGLLNQLHEALLNHFLNDPVFGAIIGEVTIKYCVESSKSPWFVGRYGFVLANPVLYDTPIPCRGQLGFFKPNFKEEKIGDSI